MLEQFYQIYDEIKLIIAMKRYPIQCIESKSKSFILCLDLTHEQFDFFVIVSMKGKKIETGK